MATGGDLDLDAIEAASETCGMAVMLAHLLRVTDYARALRKRAEAAEAKAANCRGALDVIHRDARRCMHDRHYEESDLRNRLEDIESIARNALDELKP